MDWTPVDLPRARTGRASVPFEPRVHRRVTRRIAWLFAGVVALLALLALAGCANHSESGLARVRRTGVLRWGGDMQGGEPYVAEDPAHPGRLVGFEVELAGAVARELGVRSQFVQNDWPNLAPALDRGTFDVIMNGLEVTPSRAAQVLFTRPYFLFSLRLMARRDDTRIRGLASLRGMRVGSLANSAAWHLLQSRGALPQPYDGSNEPYEDLEAGRTDAVLLDDIIAMRYGQGRPALRVVDDVQDGYYAVGLRRGDTELCAAVDTALARIARSGELRHILDHWNIDSERQERLSRWTDVQTRELLSTSHAQHFEWIHLWLFAQAAFVTMLVSLGAMMLAVPLGMAVAIARLYGPRAMSSVSAGYVELFRGTPVLLQLYVLYFGLGRILQLDAFTAAVLGLGLNYGAYEAEVYRAGVQAVPKGQMEAAVSLGMSTTLALRRIVMPQAFRLALPSVTNDFIALLKDSSLVSVITVIELTKRTNIVAENTGSWLIPGALCAAMYFVMGYPLSRIARRLEARLARA